MAFSWPMSSTTAQVRSFWMPVMTPEGPTDARARAVWARTSSTSAAVSATSTAVMKKRPISGTANAAASFIRIGIRRMCIPLATITSLSTPASAAAVIERSFVDCPHASSAPQHAWSSCQTGARCAAMAPMRGHAGGTLLVAGGECSP